jgi:integrase
MSQSTGARRKNKPAKPRPDFPLFPHATRRWAKKIRGKLHYFGPWEDPEGALNKYLDQKDDLHAGRKPRVSGDTLTVRDLLNRFLTSKKLLADAGELGARTFGEYHACCARLGKTFGLDRPVEDLAADDFEALRAEMAKTWGPVTLGNEIQRVRGVFKYAFEEGLVKLPVRFGTAFRRPARKVLRRLRRSKGPRLFEAAELRALLAAAGTQLRAMLLLAANCGFGNHDCATLPRAALDLDRGWLDYPRPKTGIERRCPLWPETVEALKAALAARPEPKDAAHAGLVFITKYGKSWAKAAGVPREDGTPAPPDNPVSKETAKLLRAVRRLVVRDREGREHTFFVPDARVATARGKAVPPEAVEPGMRLAVQDGEATVRGEAVRCEPLARPGLGFYAIRHTFETVAGASKDQVAVDFLMGHSREDMGSVYREKIGDERLQAVVSHVHAWLFGKAAAADNSPSKAG